MLDFQLSVFKAKTQSESMSSSNEQTEDGNVDKIRTFSALIQDNT